VEHKARLRFLKEKERYERVEAQLRSIEADYEVRHFPLLFTQRADNDGFIGEARTRRAADRVVGREDARVERFASAKGRG
jgi:hypothetical protein